MPQLTLVPCLEDDTVQKRRQADQLCSCRLLLACADPYDTCGCSPERDQCGGPAMMPTHQRFAQLYGDDCWNRADRLRVAMRVRPSVQF